MSELEKTRHTTASQSLKIYLLIIIIVLLIAFLPIVSSAPPVSETIQRGVDIVHPEISYLELGKDLEVNFWTYQSSDGRTLTNAKLNCTFYFLDQQGVQFWRLSNQAGANGLINYGKGAPLCVNCWTSVVGAGNFSVGVYSYQIKCQGTDFTTPTPVAIGGYVIGGFEVTPNGLELTMGMAFVDIGLLFMLMIFLIGCVIIFMETDNLLGKVGMFGLGYLLLIAINFIAWNMATDFLLSAPFVAEMFRILFFVLIIGAFPLLLGAFGWYFFMLFKIKEIENLMKHGMPQDEAERRTRRRK